MSPENRGFPGKGRFTAAVFVVDEGVDGFKNPNALRRYRPGWRPRFPRFEFGNPFCVVGVGLSGPGLGFQMEVYAPLPCGLSAMEKNRIPSAIP